MIVTCPQCSAKFLVATGGFNRAAKRNAPLYCGRTCSGLGRRVERTREERQELKAEYDKQRRADLGDAMLEKKRAAYHAAVAVNPEKVREREKANRSARRHEHLEYCRRPEYREWKRSYDRRHLAAKQFGPFADAALLLRDLEQAVLDRASRYDLDLAAGRLNKAKRRKQEYEKAIGC